MAKKVPILLLLACWLCLSGLPLRAQSFQWSRTAGSSSTWTSSVHSDPNKIFRDSKDNIYYCLSFAGTNRVTIEGREVYKPSGIHANECCAVVCYDCEGNMKWYRTIFSKDSVGNSANFFNQVTMVEDTLVISFSGCFTTLYICDNTHVLDTVTTDKFRALWMSTDNGRAIRTAPAGPLVGMSYSGNKLHLLLGHHLDDTTSFIDDDSAYVRVCSPQGEEIRHFSLDFYTYPYFDKTTQNIEADVYHDRYYVLYHNVFVSDSLWFGSQLYVDSSIYEKAVLACFDSTGQCLWSRLLNAFCVNQYTGASHIAIDESTGLIYITASGAGYDPVYPDRPYNIFDGDTLWGADMIARQGDHKLVLACYDTLGNKQWVKYTHGPGNMNVTGMNLLPGRKLAIGGHTDGDAILDGMHTNLRDVERAAYFAIYDLVKDSFVLLQTLPKNGYHGTFPYTFNTDKDGNLLFAGLINEGNYVVCGSDTLYGDSPKTHLFYGRYGWPCDSAAHWSGPPQHTLTLNVGQPSMGTVSGAGTYSGGSQVPISATPYPGHAFDHWSDGSSDNPRTILLLSDSSITAHFVKQHTEGISPAERPQPALFPNPATEQVQILGLDGEAPDVEIFDMTGRTVATFHHATTLDISHLPQGSYILSIQTATTKYHLRLVKR